MIDVTSFLENSKTKVAGLISDRDANLKIFNTQKARLEQIGLKTKALGEAKAAISFEIEDIQKTLKKISTASSQ